MNDLTAIPAWGIWLWYGTFWLLWAVCVYLFYRLVRALARMSSEE